MKLALMQTSPTDGDEAAAFARLDRALGAAAAAGAEMLVAPELLFPGYNRPDLHRARAQPIGGAWETRCADLCQKSGCGLTFGWAERDGDWLYNAASAFDHTGQKLAHYRKRQLFGPMEQAVFTPGDPLVCFELGGQKAALLICYDVEFADLVQHVAAQEVTLLLVPTANPEGYEIVSDALVPSRAYETGMSIAYANYCGQENGLTFGGKSVIVGPDGAALAKAGQSETLLVVDLAQTADIAPEFLSTQRRDRRALPR